MMTGIVLITKINVIIQMFHNFVKKLVMLAQDLMDLH